MGVVPEPVMERDLLIDPIGGLEQREAVQDMQVRGPQPAKIQPAVHRKRGGTRDRPISHAPLDQPDRLQNLPPPGKTARPIIWREHNLVAVVCVGDDVAGLSIDQPVWIDRRF